MAGLIPLDLEQKLAEAQQGNAAVLGELLEQYRAYLNLLARVQIGRHLAGKVDASDVVQEAFLRAGRDFARFRGRSEGELLAWLRRILACTLVDETRRHAASRDANLEARLVAALDHSSQVLGQRLACAGSTPSQQSVRREEAVLLADALARLPEHYREVLVLRHVEDLSFPEAARRMGRSLDSVKHLWIRAVAALRQAYGSRS